MPVRQRARRRTPAPISESLQRLGERVRRARAEAGLSQAKLGAPHFTRAYVSAIELGKVRPAMKSLEFMATKLGRPVSYFVEDEQQEMRRRERELDIAAVASLLNRATASQALDRIAQLLLDDVLAPSEIARLRVMAGTAHNFLADGAQALRELVVAERLAAQLGDQGLLRSVRHQSAIAHRSLGSHRLAEGLLVSLLREVEDLPVFDQVFRMKLLKDLGAVAFDLGEHERASGYYRAALESAKDVGDIAGLISIYNGLGYSHRAAGDLDAATGYLQRALGATEISNDLTAAAVMHNALAIVAAERGHFDAAYSHVDRAIEIARVNGPAAYVPHYLNTKAECALKLNRLEEAQAFAQDALQLAERTENQRAAATARVVLGDVAARAGAISDGMRWLKEAADIYRALGARAELGDVLMRLSRLAQGGGDPLSAQRYAELAYEATKTVSGLVGRSQ